MSGVIGISIDLCGIGEYRSNVRCVLTLGCGCIMSEYRQENKLPKVGSFRRCDIPTHQENDDKPDDYFVAVSDIWEIWHYEWINGGHHFRRFEDYPMYRDLKRAWGY